MQGQECLHAVQKLEVCIDRVRSGLKDFLTQPTMIGQKKFNPTQSSPSYKSNPTQPTWDGLGQVEPMGWTNLLLLLLLLLLN